MDIFDKLMGRSALKKAEGPPAPSTPPSASSTAQTDLAAAIAANPNNQPKPAANQGFAGGAGGHSKIVNPETHQGKLDGN